MERAPTDDLLIRSLQRRTTPEEEAYLLGWRASTVDNDRRYRRLAELWALVGLAALPPREGAPRKP